jgi:hypothetical protein
MSRKSSVVSRKSPVVGHKKWSGRRGSNPRPTAWKAVTLPLSYSRLRGSLERPLATSAGRPAAASRRALLSSPPRSSCRRVTPGWLAIRGSRRERRMVAREGFEPSKPLGRQIYSLLRLTASLPRLLSVVDCGRSMRFVRTFPEKIGWRDEALELAKGFEPPTG